MRRGRFSFFTKPGEKEVMGEVVFFLYDVLPWERGDDNIGIDRKERSHKSSE
ncbi:hypothetical protein JHK82_043444 [Glycine max]|nr:hypothetical protein JHK82_043444 [Glycine max]